MKYLILFCFLAFLIILQSGCDSATDSKSISTAPPVLVSPYDNDSNVATLTTFVWTGTADVIWLDVNSSFSNPVSYAVSGTTFTVTDPLSSYGSYYWKAGRTIGSTTYWSDNYYYFRTGAN
jgi:hypothetical protein